MFNQCTLLGRITNKLELKQTDQGTKVLSFSIAVQRKYDKNKTDFFNIVAWKGLAETIFKYFKKGDRILITGNLQTRYYENKQGQKVHITELVAEEITFIEYKDKEEKYSNLTSPPAPKEHNQTQTINDVDIPPFPTEAPPININDFENIEDIE